VQDMVTAEALAHLFGVSAKTIRALARRGIVVKAGRNLFTLADSVQHYCGHLRDLAHGRKDGDAAPTERARLAAAQAPTPLNLRMPAHAARSSIPRPSRGNGKGSVERFASGCFGFLSAPPRGFRT
jgi:hypothetical protein